MNQTSQASNSTVSLLKAALVSALYIALAMISPFNYGFIQFRIAEIMNFVGIYNRRYFAAIVLAVAVVNLYGNGPVDMVVGAFHTFVALWLSRYLGQKLVERFDNVDATKLRYVATVFSFTVTMFIIAGMLMVIVPDMFSDYNLFVRFMIIYGTLFISELIIMTLGAFIMYPLSKRIDFES